MNDNFIFFRYNNDNTCNKNNLDISPRTHISVISKDNKKDDSIKEESKNEIKKRNLIEKGIIKLITLGRQTKKFMPSKESILNKKRIYTDSNYWKNKSCKKLTPFQVYEKNKKLIEISLKKNSQKTLYIKSFNSEEFNKNNRENLKKRLNTNIYSTPNKHYNTISCNFKNKLIKSMFEKKRIKIQSLNDNIDFTSPSNSKKYLLSIENTYNKNSKKAKILNDFYIRKEKILPIYQVNQNTRKKRKITLSNHNYNNYYNINEFSKNKNKSYNNNNFIDLCNNIYSQMPLVQLNSIHFSNKKISNLFLNKFNYKNVNKNKKY